MAVLLAGLALGRRFLVVWLWGGALWQLGALGTRAWTDLELSVVAGLLAIAVPVGFVAAFLIRRPWLVGVLVAGVLLVIASEVRVRSRAFLWRKGHSMGFTARYWVRSALAVDDRPEGYRIALTAGAFQPSGHWLSYPMLGSRLQNTVFYVPFTRSGRIAEEYDPDYASEADRDAWIRRLRSARVDFVMCFSPPGPELEWMEQSPESFGRVEGRGSRFGLYRLMSSEAPSPREEGTPAPPHEGGSDVSTDSREAQRSGS
jgi:hypothetical protein